MASRAYDRPMDHQTASLGAHGAFDPEAQLPAAPEPWDYMPTPAHRDGPPWAMAEMIAAEPALVARVGARVVASGAATALAAAVRVAAERGEQVVVTGCGTSEHAAMGVAAILRDGWRAAGLPGTGPVAAQAFELALDAPAGGLVIGISHEGSTTATLAALDAARARGAQTAAITGSAHSPISSHADIVLATVEMDRSWCHTVGYVSPLAAATVTAGILAGGTPNTDKLRARLRAGIDATDGGGHTGIAGAIAASTHLLILASGVDRVTACEFALKMEEAVWIPASVRDLETFLHGHLPATGSDTSLVLVLTEREGLDARTTRARQALAAAMVVGIRPAAILGADAATRIPEALTPAGRIVIAEGSTMPGAPASLLGAAGPLQLVTLAAAAARGTNPDPIRRDDPVYLRAAEVADAPAPLEG
jgi:glucosamine--fructose-6-phosphate aminotransferase (isomerizing)